MKVMTVVGARPNFMKAAPIIAAIRKHNNGVSAGTANESGKIPFTPITHVLVHTGQHYDQLMSDSFFADLNLPKPDVHLGVGSGSHALQTAEIMRKFEGVLLQEKPDVLVVVGDVNSTVACALVAAKISFDASGTRPLIAHVEAGLRSFDGTMPEEINRIVTDHLSDLLFVTEETGLRNLTREGVPDGKIHFVGNTMIDSLLAFKDKAEASTILERLGLRAQRHTRSDGNSIIRYGLLTLHRPSNVDNRETFLNIVSGLEELIADCPIVFPVHPRTRQRIAEFNLGRHLGANATTGSEKGIILTDPLGYLDFLCLMKYASIVVTDSGGIQEETTILRVPCVTVRENTERPVTVECGTNIIAGTNAERIRQAIRRQKERKGSDSVPENWDGQAAPRIINVLIRSYHVTTSSQNLPLHNPAPESRYA
jgi:UDP-N-acetylglucosamine 2-epimerase (non-hydrolysing)